MAEGMYQPPYASAPMTPSRIPAIFADLRTRSAKGLMPFICGGHPAPGDTTKLLHALAKGGASIVEVGFPFSDPIADGPVIAAAMYEALGKGVTPSSVLAEIRAYRENDTSLSPLGIVAMISISLVHTISPAKFIAEAKAAGVDGFIFPDVPVEESADLTSRCKDAGLTASLLVAPTTPPERAARIAKSCTGFVYMLARAGITGEGAEVPDVAPRVSMLRGVTDLPIAVGFGVSTAHHVRQIVHEGGADAAIVGSALVRRLTSAAASGVDSASAAESFTRELAAGLI